MMDDKPFGKFVISAGVGMAGLTTFNLFGVVEVQSRIGSEVTPYLIFVLIGISVIAVGFFNDRYKSNVTVPLGVIGWIITFVMLYLFYSRIGDLILR